MDDDCFTVIVPKEICVGTLIANLEDLTDASKIAYETGGGLPGAGFDKARLVVNGSVDDVLQKAPRFIRSDEGLITVLPVRKGGGTAVPANGTEDASGAGLVASRFTVMPGRTASRAGTLKMGVLAVGIARSDTNVGRPMRQFFAEFFSAPEDDVG